jgi:ABC-type polysaccharide/polyol phosphate transport system ATPase subunit
VVGINGSGKSTLLLALAGVFPPDEGSVVAHGSPMLLTLGAGFEIELTGRQNIYLNAAYLGISRRETDSLLDTIIEFSELGEFIDVPLRQYSTGMRARLGFAVIAHLHPDILLIDEALSVGDAAFQAKSRAKMAELMDRAGAIVMVSHDPGFLSKICERVLWLEDGQIEALGAADEVLEAYKAAVERQAAEQVALASNP